MRNFHAFEVKYLGPTNTKGSRIKITSKRFDQSITVPYSYEFNKASKQAVSELEKRGYVIVGQAEFGDKTIILSTTFESFK